MEKYPLNGNTEFVAFALLSNFTRVFNATTTTNVELHYLQCFVRFSAVRSFVRSFLCEIIFSPEQALLLRLACLPFIDTNQNVFYVYV